MASFHPTGARASLRSLVLGCTILSAGGWVQPVQAKDAGIPVILVGEPEGFSDLTESQVLLVDVYFGGVRKGEAKISAVPGAVSFLEPAATLALLPELTDRAAVEAALAAGDLPANAALACSNSTDPAICGDLDPDVVGVIFDRNHFRLDIFLNPRFIAVNELVADAYLPEPEGGVAMINSIGAVLSGRLGEGSSYYNFQDNIIVGNGERRLRADLSYASELGFGAERIALEWDRPGLRYSAGALWAPGNDLFGRRKLVGAGIETQIDTRLDKDVLSGSPVVVYLQQRARVDIVRDGRVLSSAIYEAGNQQLDTSMLPDGAYDIILRIEEPGQPAREERRFFNKNRRVPSEGRTDFFAFGGMLVDASESHSLDVSNRPYLQGGVAHRLSKSWVVEGGVEATDETATAEVAAVFLSDIVQLRAAAVANLSGTYGGVLQIMSGGYSRLNFNFDLRRIEADEFDGGPIVPPGSPGSPSGLPGSFWQGGSYSQIGGVVSFSLASIRFLGTFFYRDDPTQEARYSIGPALEWDVLQKGPFTLTMRGDATATDRGRSGFAGISLRFLGARSSLTGLGGTRASTITGDDLGEGPAGAVSASWSPSLGAGELALGAGLEHQPNRDNIVGSTEFRHRLGTLAGDLVHSEGQGSSATQYSLGLQTTLIAGAGSLQVAGRTTTESMIVAHVKGASKDDRFDVYVDEQVAGSITGAEPFTLSLPPYRAYDVRIRPTGEGLLAYDSASRKVSLYPGTVSNLDWVVSRITIKFGRLTAPDGSPLRGASITGKGVWSETDDNGYFQIEASDNADLEVTLNDGRTYAMTLPTGEVRSGIARLGAIVCCTETEIQLGSLGELPSPANGGSK
ncbi:CS1-pili formation C-terminal domain-containing protein [Altererythrobacter sp. Root672]|uniref:CS1-pili formation C-terminal domain-containing protein n=1 Tax=Altererythrobacter sp. Root672 TaxID=1736584 RepID=UPI0012E37B20|nr:CS1-pili formation C-terminal domain-containing protein [Altererythrobacter sp. Root672]